MNCRELEQTALVVADRLLKTKGHIAVVEVFIETGHLSKSDYEAWRFGRVPYLEKVIRTNLSRINKTCRTLHVSARRGCLRPSWTAYVKWGEGARTPLRFTKSGDEKLEQAWATHYLPPHKI